MALLEPGDWISDTLVIERPLGEGAFAEVHRVRHKHLGRQALKLFKKVASIEETNLMLDEARLLSTLGHPNIVRLFDAGTVRTAQGWRGYFTMEYVPDGSLDRFIDRNHPVVPTDQAIEVIEQIASGLAVAHDQTPPIVHRDVTLANILVGQETAGLRVRMSDFGLAKRADPLTQLASAQGTYAFMAPEVLRDEGYSCASDVWSVGTIAYLLLTDRFPFGGGPFSSYSLARFTAPLLPPSRFNDEVDAELDAIVLSCLEIEPRNRIANARVLGDACRARRTGTDRATQRATVVPSLDRARRLVKDAIALSRRPGQLTRAADLLEEAMDTAPALRDAHAHRVSLWRKGVLM